MHRDIRANSIHISAQRGNAIRSPIARLLSNHPMQTNESLCVTKQSYWLTFRKSIF